MSSFPGQRPLVTVPPLQQPDETDTQTPSYPPAEQVAEYEQIPNVDPTTLEFLTIPADIPTLSTLS
jgi:hypothetical protein